MKIRILLTIVTCMVVFSASARAQPYIYNSEKNLVQNPGFETSTGKNKIDGWSYSNSSCCGRVNNVAHTGDYSAFIESNRADRGKWWSSDFIKVKSNRGLHVAAWLKIENVRLGNNLWNKAAIGILFYDKDKNITSRMDLVRDEGSRKWSRYSKNIVVPEKVKFIKLKFYFAEAYGKAWLDDIAVYEIPEYVGKKISESKGNDLVEITIDADNNIGDTGNINGIVYESSRRKFIGVSELKPTIIRVPSIISHHYSIIGYDKSGQIKYTWEKYDSDINSIVELGAVPFISIGWVPHAFEEDIRNKQYNSWKRFIHELVSRYSSKYDITNWYWNFWNEPSTYRDYGNKRNHINWFGSESDFHDFYKATVDAALEANNKIKIGAAGFVRNSPWLFGLIEWCGINNVRLDFVSWHSYGEIPENIGIKALEIRKHLAEYKNTEHSEIIIDEWNSYAETGDRRVESSGRNNYAAAYRVAAITEMIKAGVNANIWFNMYEEKYGVFYNNVKWPVYNTFSLVSELGSRVVEVKGNQQDPYISVLATIDDNQNLSVLLSYLKHPMDVSTPGNKIIKLIIKNTHKSEPTYKVYVIDEFSNNIVSRLEAGISTDINVASVVNMLDTSKIKLSVRPNSVILVKAISEN